MRHTIVVSIFVKGHLRISERTVGYYVKRYKENGPQELLFYRQRKKSPRIYDEKLRSKILEMINDSPTLSVPSVRRLLSDIEKYKEKTSVLSDRILLP